MLTLAITGFDANPDLITEMLGFEPTSIGRKGEPSQSGKPRTFNGWWHDVEPQRLVDARQHADAMARMLAQLHGRENRFVRLREVVGPRGVTIYGGLYVPADSQCGVSLEPDQMQLLAACGISWGLDLFEEEALASLANEADCMSNWTGLPPLRVLDELAAFDAMRRFLEIWWEVGGRSEDNIANILSSTGRTMGLNDSAPQGAPTDRALWEDWRNAISLVLRNGSAPNKDPLANGS